MEGGGVGVGDEVGTGVEEGRKVWVGGLGVAEVGPGAESPVGSAGDRKNAPALTSSVTPPPSSQSSQPGFFVRGWVSSVFERSMTCQWVLRGSD